MTNYIYSKCVSFHAINSKINCDNILHENEPISDVRRGKIMQSWES